MSDEFDARKVFNYGLGAGCVIAAALCGASMVSGSHAAAAELGLGLALLVGLILLNNARD